MLVYDPQIDGMTDGIYTPGGFLKGWNSGNDFAHSALFSASASTEIHSLPAATLEAHWRWNVGLDALRERYAAENLFVPQIWYVSYRGRLCSAVSWAEGADTALPLVDLILTYRSPSRLAKLAGGKPEQLVVKMSGVMPRLERFERRGDPYEHFIVRFGGSRAASGMAKLVEGRHGNWNELRRLNNARVLNAEIVDRYLSVAGRR